jgi:pimeloyl-ACP methyl ester carboxylesterase
VVKAFLAALAAALVLVGGASHASPTFSQQDLTIAMDDGVTIAATLYEPTASPPVGGWPAVVLMHGLGGDRSSMNALAQAMGLVGERYAVLTFDARGHGASGGLIGIDGPREIADVREIYDWLAARPEVADAKIGALGISLGGGAVLDSLAAGVPWAAVEVADTWTDLYSALAPNGLAKSGVIAGFLGLLPPEKLDPSVQAVASAAFAGTDQQLVRSWADARSSLSGLRGKRTPVFFMQGRRDFAFGIDQAARGFAVLKGPKRLWIGNAGHAPSTFPAADTPKMLAEGKQWFDHFLRGARNGIERSKPIVIAAEGSSRVEQFAALPNTTLGSDAVGGRATLAPKGKVVRSFGRTRAPLEVFGSPTVRVDSTTALGGWPRLVAVLTARPPTGGVIVVAGGGVPTRAGRHAYTFMLGSQATFVPKGSRLQLTLGASSTVQNPSDLLYLDLPMPAAAKLKFGAVRLWLPRLALPISK